MAGRKNRKTRITNLRLALPFPSFKSSVNASFKSPSIPSYRSSGQNQRRNCNANFGGDIEFLFSISIRLTLNYWFQASSFEQHPGSTSNHLQLRHQFPKFHLLL